jgi:hypothetical protein
MALRCCFHRWAANVELFALRKRTRKRVDGHTYVALHGELIAKCRAAAAAANEVEAAFYRYIEDLAQPWLAPSALERADREILFDLLMRCRQIDQELGGRPWASYRRAAVAPFLVIFFAFALLPLWRVKSSGALATILDRARFWTVELSHEVNGAGDSQMLILIGSGLLIVAIWLVFRAARQ